MLACLAIAVFCKSNAVGMHVYVHGVSAARVAADAVVVCSLAPRCGRCFCVCGGSIVFDNEEENKFVYTDLHKVLFTCCGRRVCWTAGLRLILLPTVTCRVSAAVVAVGCVCCCRWRVPHPCHHSLL